MWDTETIKEVSNRMRIDQHVKDEKEVAASLAIKATEGRIDKTTFIRVYNLKVIFKIRGIKEFEMKAILDT